MTGPYDGILGMRREPVIEKFLTALPKRFEVVEQGRGLFKWLYLGHRRPDGTGKRYPIDPNQR